MCLAYDRTFTQVERPTSQAHKYFVQFLIATSFASQEDLGYDPTVTRHHDHVNNRIDYEYLVHDDETKSDVRYRTVGDALSNYRTYHLLGGGVRVWTVKMVGPDGTLAESENVLKDY